MKLMDKLRREDGAALVTALVFLVILTLLGYAAIMTSGTEIMISRNDRLNKLALNYANAGIQDALARVDLSVGNSLCLGNWSSTAVSANAEKNRVWKFRSNQLGMDLSSFTNFTGTVKFRLEDSMHNYSGYNPANPRVVGYSKDCQYTKSPITSIKFAFPVYQITSIGTVLVGGQTAATATVVTEVSRNSLNLNTPGGLYSNSCVTLGGNCAVSGNNQSNAVVSSTTGCASPDPTHMTGGGYTTTTSVNMTNGQFLGASLDDLKAMAQAQGFYYSSASLIPNSPAWGGFANETDPAIVYVDGPFHLTNSTAVEGYGILIVNGDMQIDGSIQWKGLVYVLGNLTMQGGGNVQTITGGIMANGTVTTNVTGHANIGYDLATLQSVERQGFTTKILNWKQVLN